MFDIDPEAALYSFGFSLAERSLALVTHFGPQRRPCHVERFPLPSAFQWYTIGLLEEKQDYACDT